MTAMRAIAAIDIGTSSMHMVIAEPVPGGRPEILLREKLPVRLGSGPKDMKRLDPAAVDRAIDALITCRALADANAAEVHAVATSAVREAEDPEVFLDRARDEAGIDVAVIAGVEEARLIHLGVLGAVDFEAQKHLVIDIGGGSTEVIVGEGRTPLELRSLKLGHVRLADRFFPDGRVEADSVDRCRTFIRSFVARLAPIVREHEVAVAAGSSGTFETLAAMRDALAPRPVGEIGAGRTISLDEVSEICRRVSSIVDAPDRNLPGLDAHRSDTIVAGALLAETLMTEFGLDDMMVSPDALREGLVLDRIDRRTPGEDALLHLDSIRASSVLRVAARHGENVVHARQSTDIALRLFDAAQDLHGHGDDVRDVLEAAGMLHNIGRFVGHGAHHKHSYYLIRNSEHLAGFNERELELIAQVARYHRKSAPKSGHRAFAALSEQDQGVVSLLAGMLRIGIALDRTYRNAAADLTVCIDDVVTIGVRGDDLELELFAANERKALLESALGRAVEIVPVGADA